MRCVSPSWPCEACAGEAGRTPSRERSERSESKLKQVESHAFRCRAWTPHFNPCESGHHGSKAQGTPRFRRKSAESRRRTDSCKLYLRRRSTRLSLESLPLALPLSHPNLRSLTISLRATASCARTQGSNQGLEDKMRDAQSRCFLQASGRGLSTSCAKAKARQRRV